MFDYRHGAVLAAPFFAADNRSAVMGTPFPFNHDLNLTAFIVGSLPAGRAAGLDSGEALRHKWPAIKWGVFSG